MKFDGLHIQPVYMHRKPASIPPSASARQDSHVKTAHDLSNHLGKMIPITFLTFNH